MLKRQKEETNGDALVSTILFNSSSKTLHDRIPLDKVEPLTEEDYQAGGMTALLDAVGETVTKIKTIHEYGREEDKPQKTLFVITTDGEENSSHKFDYNDVKKLIEQQKELGWEFIFLGANIEAAEVAGHIGISSERAVNYHADAVGTRGVFDAISKFSVALSLSDSVAKKDRSWREDLDEDYNSRKK